MTAAPGTAVPGTEDMPDPAEFSERLCDLWGLIDENVRCESEAMARRIGMATEPISDGELDDAREHLAYLERLATRAAVVTSSRTITGSYHSQMQVQAHMRAIVNDLSGYERLAHALAQYERWGPPG